MDRRKRPSLSRTTPIRSWATWLGGAGAPPDGGPPPSLDADGKAGLEQVIARSVDLAYRVVDDYLQQGQRAAERLAGRAYGADSFATDVQDVSVRLVRYASDMASLWLDAFDLRWSGAPSAADAEAPSTTPAAASGAPSPTAAAPPAAPPARIAIELCAARPAEVALDLRPEAAGAELIVHTLRAVESEKPALREVTLEPGAGDAPARLRIRVPPDQPAGSYHGLIVDAGSNRPVGTLSVRLSDA